MYLHINACIYTLIYIIYCSYVVTILLLSFYDIDNTIVKQFL